jgi:two-component system osmolarity sensor histidine kinase EnvZ
MVYTAHGPMMIEFRRSRVGVQPTSIAGLDGGAERVHDVDCLYLPWKSVASHQTARGGIGRIRTCGMLLPTIRQAQTKSAQERVLDMRKWIEQTQTRIDDVVGVSHDLRTPLTRLRLGLGLWATKLNLGPR